MLAPVVAAFVALLAPEPTTSSDRAPASSAPSEPSTSKGPPPPPRPDPWPKWRRRGLMLRGSSGLMHCGQPVCDGIPLGGLARLDAGYRAGFYSLWVTVDGGGGRLDIPPFEDEDGLVTSIHGDLTFLYAAVGASVHPVDLGRVDPYVGASIGYSRVLQRFRSDQRSFDLLYRRGGVTPSFGFDVYLVRRVSMGPRADILFPFAGSQCIRRDGQEECLNTADIVDADDSAVTRARRRTFPRPWSVSLQVTVFVL